MKRYIACIGFAILLLLTGCMQSPPVTPEGVPSLELKLDFSGALHKTDGLVQLPVFDLEYNVSQGFYDDSDFHHELSTYSIENGDVYNGNVSADFAGFSYMQIMDSYNRFTGINGFQISITYNMTDSTNTNQILVEKMDSQNLGYRIGLQHRVPYLLIRPTVDESLLLTATGPLAVNQWHTIKATYQPRLPYMTLTGQVDTTIVPDTTLGVNGYAPLMVGNSFYNSGLGFIGMISDIKMSANLEFEDFDQVRVAVMDANTMARNSSLPDMTSQEMYSYFNSYQSYQDSTGWYDVTEDLYHLESDTTDPNRKYDLGAWREVWDKHFVILSEQNLVVKNGFAEGIVNGVPGLNLVAVGALRGEKLIYYGYGFAWGYTDRGASVYVYMSGNE